ncbi:hypothetical protein GA0070606_1231 [Micromonospora citrea]|uniref:Uncharacterized protein n=1 Tax=Micromonospora citrea TaxID=47855 RepID=A0A1C6U1L2_9ACTN|nr:hypothetical protein GA0070606_1231 [Micromonospora citrea]
MIHAGTTDSSLIPTMASRVGSQNASPAAMVVAKTVRGLGAVAEG